MTRLFLVCILFAVCTLTLSLELHQIKGRNLFHKKLNMLNKESQAIDARALKTKLEGVHTKHEIKKMMDGEIHAAKKQIDHIKKEMKGLHGILHGKLANEPPNHKSLLERRWNSLNKIVEEKSKIIDDMLSGATCFTEKACFHDEWNKADAMFETMLGEMEKIQAQCKEYSKDCIKHYQALKEKFVQFNQEKVDLVRAQVAKIKDAGCFASDEERSALSKKLLNLECRVEGMILNIQFSVTALVKSELQENKDELHRQENLVHELKVDASKATTKAELEEIFHKLKILFLDSIKLKENFLQIYECVHELKGWLPVEDYEELHRITFRMYYDIGAVCIDIEEQKSIVDQKIKIKCLDEDVQTKTDSLETLLNGDNADADDDGLTGISTEIKALTSENTCEERSGIQTRLTTIITKVEECKDKIAELFEQLDKDVPTTLPDHARIMALLEAQKTKALEELHEPAKKYVYYLNIYDALFCIPHDNSKDTTEETEPKHDPLFHTPLDHDHDH